jgi:hypothetical protein
MKLKTFYTIKGIITAIFALGFLLAPVFTWGIYDIQLQAEGLMLSRYLGVGFIAIFFVCWLNRDSDPAAQANATLNLAITDTIGFVIALVEQLNGVPNAMGWINVVLWFLLAAGNIYFHWFA